MENEDLQILDEFKQKLVYYENGGTFNIDPVLINFTKTFLDLEYTHDVPFVDANGFPVVIVDVQKFFDEILLKYMTALNEYSVKFADIKSKRKIADMVEI